MNSESLPDNITGHARQMLEKRARLFGPNDLYFYENPIHFVRGEGVWLYDHEGRRYLDCYNNVPHVGHCHPRVVEAISRQTATLNTHARYLHENMLDYAERLTGTFAPSLDTMLYTCTGSEANDVALRMAQSITGNKGLIATDCTYHGNTSLVMDLASLLPHEETSHSYIRFIPAPDSYHLAPEEQTKEEMAARVIQHLEAAIESLQTSGHGVAAILMCPIFANEGFPDLPKGFMSQISQKIRNAGGVVISDEVQAGFGRSGAAMWGHQYTGFIPDIVTMGKPMGNGYPIAGVVARQEIMHNFRTKNCYFNTFGANPVACAAALATLDVIEEENLIDNAGKVGAYAKDQLKGLQEKYPQIGDVRGSGFFFGAEFVKNRKAREPNSDLAKKVMNRMREQGVVMGVIGRYNNLLKIRPPMPFSMSNADYLFDKLEHVLEGI